MSEIDDALQAWLDAPSDDQATTDRLVDAIIELGKTFAGQGLSARRPITEGDNDVAAQRFSSREDE